MLLSRSLTVSIVLALGGAMLPATQACAQVVAPAVPGTGRVVASGVVPDERTRQAVLQQLRTQYGVDRVEDQLGVGPLVAPPSWSDSLSKVLAQPSLKQVRRGALRVKGQVIELSGEVDNEAIRQQVLSDISTQLNPTYTVRSTLTVAAAPSPQRQLDAALAQRTIEFLPASATLSPQGQKVLDELLPVLSELKGRRFEVVGHTDADGDRELNISLSVQRANAVRQYLAARGVPYASILTSGAGPDRPVAGNDTPEGRARNRRIEFRVLEGAGG